MNKTKLTTLGILAFSLAVCSIQAQGLIGERYAGVSFLYEDIDRDGFSIDGWGGGFGINVPITEPEEQFGFDLFGSFSYARASESGIEFDGYGIAGGIRGYLRANQGITPYAAIGLGWSRSKVSVLGFSESESSFTLPLGVGVEFQAGQFSIIPFFNYLVALESDFEDAWSVGVTAAYWFTPTVGGSLSFAHTDYDNNVESQGISIGLLLGF